MANRKANLFRFKNVTAGDMSADVTSVVTNIEQLDNIGFQAVWTGAPVGSIDVQISLDYTQDSFGNVINAGTWTSIGLNPTPTTGGAAGSVYVDINQISAPWIRLKFIRTSGTGTLNSYITGKMC